MFVLRRDLERLEYRINELERRLAWEAEHRERNDELSLDVVDSAGVPVPDERGLGLITPRPTRQQRVSMQRALEALSRHLGVEIVYDITKRRVAVKWVDDE